MKKLILAIPSNILEDSNTLQDKTQKIGVIARASSLFSVSEIFVYDIPHKKNDSVFITKILKYLNTPPYLRKKIYSIQNDLKFAGILPPIKTHSHVVPSKIHDVNVGDIRMGFAYVKSNICYVDIGLKQDFILRGQKINNKVILCRIDRLKSEFICSPADPIQLNNYWGYEVHRLNSLYKLINSSEYDCCIITSRLGDSIEKHQKDFNSKLHNDRLLVVFGSPFVSVLDVVKKENIYLDDKKISTFNFFTDQKVETIRSEEAIMGCLSIINYTSKIQS